MSDPAGSPQRTPPNTTSPPTGLFFGEDGLRPGWGVLIFSALMALFYPMAEAIAVFLAPVLPGVTGSLGPLLVLLMEAPFALAVLAATALLSLLEGRSLADYGLSRLRLPSRLIAGAITGGALLSLLVLTLRVTGALAFNGLALRGIAILTYAFAWLLTYLCVAFYEETLFRGYLQATLTRGLTALFRLAPARNPRALAFWTSGLLLSFGFGILHATNPGESRIGEFAAGAIGLIFCLSLYRTGSLWWAIGFHAAWDWAESYLFGVPDSGVLSRGHLLATRPHGLALLSGGSTGPEGSILIIPILLLMTLWIIIALRPAVDPPPTSSM